MRGINGGIKRLIKLLTMKYYYHCFINSPKVHIPHIYIKQKHHTWRKTWYSRVRLFRSHSDKKRTSNYPQFELSVWMTESEMSYKCTGGVGVGLTLFSLVALLQTHACNVGGQTHIQTRITCRAEHGATCTLFYRPEKLLSLCQNKKKITRKSLQTNRTFI